MNANKMIKYGGSSMEKRMPIFIERQRTFTKQRGSFGPLGNISDNGCGVIALYNVLEYFGIRVDFMKIAGRFSRRWLVALPFGGFMGTSIFYLFYELVKYGFQVRPVVFTENMIRNMSAEGTSFIMLYLWRKKFRFGGHFQAGFVGENGEVTLHNPKVTYSDLKDMLAEKKKR